MAVSIVSETVRLKWLCVADPFVEACVYCIRDCQVEVAVCGRPLCGGLQGDSGSDCQVEQTVCVVSETVRLKWLCVADPFVEACKVTAAVTVRLNRLCVLYQRLSG